MENKIIGIFSSNHTTNGDLDAAFNLYKPRVIFYRQGIFVNRRFVFDDTTRYRFYSVTKIPVFVIQPYSDDDVIVDIIKDMYSYDKHIVGLDVEIDINNLVERLRRIYEKIILNTKCMPLLYTNLDFINRYKLRNTSLFTMYPLWFANYNSKMINPRWSSGVAVWQNKPKINYRDNVVINVTSEIILKPELIIKEGD